LYSSAWLIAPLPSLSNIRNASKRLNVP